MQRTLMMLQYDTLYTDTERQNGPNAFVKFLIFCNICDISNILNISYIDL